MKRACGAEATRGAVSVHGHVWHFAGHAAPLMLAARADIDAEPVGIQVVQDRHQNPLGQTSMLLGL